MTIFRRLFIFNHMVQWWESIFWLCFAIFFSFYSFSWNDPLTSSSADGLRGRFLKMLCNIYMISAIQKSSKKKVIDLRKPYIDNEINQYIKSKRRLQRLYIKYFVTYKKQYKDCRNLIVERLSIISSISTAMLTLLRHCARTFGRGTVRRKKKS